MNPFSVPPGGRILVAYDPHPPQFVELYYRLNHRRIGQTEYLHMGDYSASFASQLSNLDYDYIFEAFWRYNYLFFRREWVAAHIEERDRTMYHGKYRLICDGAVAGNMIVQVYPGPAED